MTSLVMADTIGGFHEREISNQISRKQPDKVSSRTRIDEHWQVFLRLCLPLFDTSYHPSTKDEIIINSQKKRFISSYLESKGQTEVCSMGKWLGYMVELYHDGQWYNIDQWHRHANGQLRHHFLYTAPERDILSSAHDELALSRERICFSDLAAETQDIICAENPAFERSTFDSWDFFIWGSFSDLETLLQKLAAKENDKCISKDLLETLIFMIRNQVQIFQQTIPYSVADRSSEMPIRIIICEL